MSANEIELFDDSRITHNFADLNGQRYHYLKGQPNGEAKGTVFLMHGWPDCSAGWRNQIPMFVDMGYRVIVPDVKSIVYLVLLDVLTTFEIMGFGRTAAPEVPPNSLSLYGFKRAADDMKTLAEQLGCSQIILGGHDWGGAIIFRVALWYPGFITHLFSICTPYSPPSKEPYVPHETLVEKRLPQFQYQLQLASGEVESIIDSKEQMHNFFKAMYGSQGPNGEKGFDVYKGLLAENLGLLGPCPLLSPKVGCNIPKYPLARVGQTLRPSRNLTIIRKNI